MADWRLEGQSNYLFGKPLKEIRFPDFWDNSFVNKNEFYKGIKLEAENFVKEYGRGEEYLEGKKIQDFWHTHCIFCTDKITTRDKRICYCTSNYDTWICKTCFDDFKTQFGWTLVT